MCGSLISKRLHGGALSWHASSVVPRIKPGVAPLRAGEGNSFLLRRMHSMTGIVPIGAFLLEHFISNYEAFKGPEAYGAQVKFLNSLPFVVGLELFFIWIPILYHGLYGVWIWWRGDTNVGDYPWQGNWLYTSQRWTGIIAFIYIVQHTYYLRFTGVHLPTHPMQSFAKVQGEFPNPGHDSVLRRWASSRRRGTSLWNVAVRRQVGHHDRRKSTPALWLYLSVACARPDQLGRGQHVRVPEHSAPAAGAECSGKRCNAGEVKIHELWSHIARGKPRH